MISTLPAKSELIIGIVGPTATGKTSAAVHLAAAIGGEVISADSVSVYRGLNIGAAKPTHDEQTVTRFHLIDVADPIESFNVACFKALAEQALEDIVSRGNRPIVAGGTGLYFRALLEDFGLTETPRDPTVRDELQQEAERFGTPALHAKLAEVDSTGARKIHPNDRVRIVRAMEVYRVTGEPISIQQARDAQRRKPRPSIRFGLTMNRDELNRKIDARVDAMMLAGLEHETEQLLQDGALPGSSALSSLGYREMVKYLKGNYDRQQAVDEIKKMTRRYAKRQMTWFKADRDLIWLNVEGLSAKQVSDIIQDRLQSGICSI